MVKNSLKEAIAKKRALIEVCERSLSAAEARQKSYLESGVWGGPRSIPDPGSVLRLIEKKQHLQTALRELESLQTGLANNGKPPDAPQQAQVEPSKPGERKPRLPSKKRDHSQFLDACYKLTERQQECFSLRLEREMTFQQIAAYLGINRGTAYTHVAAANRKIEHFRSNERRKAVRASHSKDK
jgi:RNA polymerase sigma factor (sigma-70 family)